MFEEVALEDRLGGDRRVAVKFGAPWCSMCGHLEREVLATAEGRAIFDGLETVGADFDAAPALARRFAILDLPTVVVLAPDGAEVGRVVGYEAPRAWIAAARAAVASDDPIPGLRAAAASGAPRAMRALGEALLSRAPDEGVAWLERASWGPDDDDASIEALWVLGRYYHRVRGEPAIARFVWQALEARAPGAGHEALFWYAKAQAELGRPEVGSRAFEVAAARAARPAPVLADWARFAGRNGYEPARAVIRAACEAALPSARGADRDQIEELIMNLGRPL
ncbi:MAG: thioredoxin family protein [Sandaracinaceae bacterium]|nr:thioredoxin family protein [Sandaracinaceae bacterium]